MVYTRVVQTQSLIAVIQLGPLSYQAETPSECFLSDWTEISWITALDDWVWRPVAVQNSIEE